MIRWLKSIRSHCRAFSLLELSISLGVIAIMMSGALVLLSDVALKRAAVEADANLQEIADALVAYKDRNGYLPCPASHTVVYGSANYGRQVNGGACDYAVAPAGTTRVETEADSNVWILSGAVPVRDLLLRDAYLHDSFGNRITYSVPQSLTSPSTFDAGDGAITVLNRAGNVIVSDGAFTLVSHGKDGKGAYRESSGALKAACGATANLDVENCDADATFRDAPLNEGEVVASYFDDTIVWKSKVDIISLDPAGVPAPDFTGFRVDGAATDDKIGSSVATGDINGDGYQDVIIGAPYADNAGTDTGSIYVIFGSPVGIETPYNVSSLNGVNGFRLDKIDRGEVMYSALSSGDINGDTFDDIIIGDAPGSGSALAGATYVVFGKASGWAATTSLATLDGTTGFRLDGVAAGDQAGFSVASGNINGDAYADVIVGAIGADNVAGDAGSAYVVFGKANGWAATLALSTLNGTTGFRLDGQAASDWAGYSVASGNVNGDAYDDVIVGAMSANNGAGDTGSTYAVFGKANGWAATTALATLNGTTGVRIDGTAVWDWSGYSVASGNLNGDDFDDVIIGAVGTDYNAAASSGSVYVVFGKAAGWAATLALSSLDGATGFRFDGVTANDQTGRVLASGDINGDGFEDVITGNDQVTGPAGVRSGAAYVIFGKASGFAANASLSTLDGTTGFLLNGTTSWDLAGGSVAMGDITGDEMADILVGAIGTDNNALSGSGSVYGIYGTDASWSATYDLNDITVP